jgi:hypothetical protein
MFQAHFHLIQVHALSPNHAFFLPNSPKFQWKIPIKKPIKHENIKYLKKKKKNKSNFENLKIKSYPKSLTYINRDTTMKMI